MPLLCLCISEDNWVIFSPFAESISEHPDLSVLISYVAQGSLLNFFMPQPPRP